MVNISQGYGYFVDALKYSRIERHAKDSNTE